MVCAAYALIKCITTLTRILQQEGLTSWRETEGALSPSHPDGQRVCTMVPDTRLRMRVHYSELSLATSPGCVLPRVAKRKNDSDTVQHKTMPLRFPSALAVLKQWQQHWQGLFTMHSIDRTSGDPGLPEQRHRAEALPAPCSPWMIKSCLRDRCRSGVQSRPMDIPAWVPLWLFHVGGQELRTCGSAPSPPEQQEN